MDNPWIRKLVLALLFFYCANLIVDICTHVQKYQWDFKTYYYAGKAFSEGLNPYHNRVLSQIAHTDISLHFVYTPVTLWVFRLFSLLDITTAFYLFPGLKCAVLIGLIHLWKARFLKDEIDLLFYPFCLLAFNATIYVDIEAGNISILEQGVLWVAFTLYMARRLLPFCVLILGVAIFKITPILFLSLLWFSDDRKRLPYFLISSTLFLGVLLASYLAAPELFADFFRTAWTLTDGKTPNPSTLSLVKYVFQVLKTRAIVLVPPGVPWALFLTIAAAVVLTTWHAFARLRSLEGRDREKIALFLSCVVYALIVPRFKEYSYILLIVPSYFIIKRATWLKGGLPLVVLSVLSAKNVPIEGVEILFDVVWTHYPLLFAYCIWILYLLDIAVATGRQGGHMGSGSDLPAACVAGQEAPS